MKNLVLFLALSLCCFIACDTTKQATENKVATETASNDKSDCIDATKINPKQPCGRIFRPVCGCDGTTYSNECEAKKVGITSFTDGRCQDASADCIDASKINPDAMCISVFEPVCGCDGKTYSNSCKAENAGVKSYTKGECK